MAVGQFDDLIPQNSTGFDDLVPEQETTPLQKAVNLGAAYTTGRTLGLGPKIAAGVGALPAKGILEARELFTGQEAPNVRELYEMGVDVYRQPIEQARKDNPILAPVAEMGGGVVSGFKMAGTKAAQQLGRLARSKGVAPKALGIGGAFASGELAERTYKAGEAPIGAEQDILLSKTPGLGGLLGGGLAAVGVAGRALAPQIDEGLSQVAQLAEKHNIPLSIDQITSGRGIKTLQKLSQNIPGSGQAAFRDAQMKAVNRGLAKTLGMDFDTFNRDNIRMSFETIGRKFDTFGKGKVFDADDLKVGMREILEDAPEFGTDDAVKMLSKNIEKVLVEIQDGKITGEKLNMLRSRINANARKTKLPDANELLRDLENVVIETLAKGDKGAMSQAKQQYKNILVLEPLLAKAKGGNLPVNQLTTRVNRIYGRNFVKGQAGEIGELADVSRELLPELGGSDTAANLTTLGLVGGGFGGALVEPSTLLISGGAMAVNRAIQSGVNRNQAIINNMTKSARKELMALPPGKAQQALDSIAINLGITSGAMQ